MEIESYIMGLRVIAPRNKSGIIRLVADLMKDHPKIDIETEIIEKLYPQDRERRQRRG